MILDLQLEQQLETYPGVSAAIKKKRICKMIKHSGHIAITVNCVDYSPYKDGVKGYQTFQGRKIMFRSLELISLL